jgi:hypothetical protein
MSTPKMRRLFTPAAVLFLLAAAALSMLAAFNQVKAMGLSWQEEHYLPQLRIAASTPAYGEDGEGPLSAGVAMGAIGTAEFLRIPRAAGATLVALRIAQNITLLLLAYGWCRALGLRPYAILLGWMAIAWALTNTAWNTHLAYDSYTEAMLCIVAAWALLRGNPAWVVPLGLLAALNRETGWILPLTVFAAVTGGAGVQNASTLRRFAIPVACALACAVGAFSLWSGYRPQVQGNTLLMANLESGRTWLQLAATFGVLPVLALIGWKRSPLPLQCITVLVTPVLFIWHFTHSPATATHNFVTPLVLCFLPLALFALPRATDEVRAE